MTPTKFIHIVAGRHDRAFDSRLALCGRLVNRLNLTSDDKGATCPKCVATYLTRPETKEAK